MKCRESHHLCLLVSIVLLLLPAPGCQKKEAECQENETLECQCANGLLGARACLNGALEGCDCTGKTVPEVEAGSVGTCSQMEIGPGRSVCVLSEMQFFNPNDDSTTGQRPLQPRKADYLPAARDLLDDCSKTHIHDQGTVGWCVAHAVLGGMELAECLVGNEPVKLSEPHLWDLGKGLNVSCAGGWYIQNAANWAQKVPIVPSKIWSLPKITNCVYDVPKVKNKKPSDANLVNFGHLKINDWYPLGARDVDTIKNSIQLGHPVVYSLWIIENTGWDGAEHVIPGVTVNAIEAPAQMPATNSQGEPCRCQCGPDVDAEDCWCNVEGVCCDPPDPHCARGGHAILLTGYDDEKKAFQMINSWGDDWPTPWSGGMFWLAYDYVEAFGKGGAAIQSVRSCVNGVCTEPSVDEDLSTPLDDVKETTDSWVVQKEGVTIELPKETPCLEPGKDVEVTVSNLGDFIASPLEARTIPLYADPRSNYFRLGLEILDYSGCYWKKELGYPPADEQPLVRITLPFDGVASTATVVMRSPPCKNGTDALFDCGDLNENSGPIWHELEDVTYLPGKATFEVPLEVLAKGDSPWILADSICKGRHVCMQNFELKGKDPAGMYDVQDCGCITGKLRIAGTDLSVLDSTIFGQLAFIQELEINNNDNLVDLGGLEGLRRVHKLVVTNNGELPTVDPVFSSLSHAASISITNNLELDTWTSGGGCPGMDEVCFTPNVVLNPDLPNCVVNRCLEHLRLFACDPGPWCKRFHQWANNKEEPDLTLCPPGNFYACSNNLACYCSGNAFDLIVSCPDYCTDDNQCDTDLDMVDCINVEYDPDLGKEVGFCADTWALYGDPYCENKICPPVFGCHKADDPDGGEICMCD